MNPDVEILRALFAAEESHVSGSQLAEQLGVTRSAVWKRMEQLQALGYPIESQPQLGYRLGTPLPDLLVADEIRARLSLVEKKRIAWNPIVFKETNSTNDLVFREASGGLAEGLVMAAERQTQGRGRQGRVWQSTEGLGLYASVLLRPAWSLQHAARLTILTSLAIAEALESLVHTSVQIKWPNDLFVDGRKLGGILTEVQGDVESIRFAVVGFGINVRHTSEDFAPELRAGATSLRALHNQELRRVDVLLAILERLAFRYTDNFHIVRAAWGERCLSLGKMIQVQTANGLRQGQAIGLDTEGALLLRGESGQVERVTSGDLF